MNTAQQQDYSHTAWRFFGMNIGYVQTLTVGGPGDRYSYTNDASKARPMTAKQCRDFCAYMKECADVGFWS